MNLNVKEFKLFTWMCLNIFLILKWLILRNLYTTLRCKGSHTKWVEERQEYKFKWSYNVWRKLPFSSDIETTITQLAYSASQLNPVSCRPQRCHFKTLSFIMQPTPHHHPPVLQRPKSSRFLIPTFIKNQSPFSASLLPPCIFPFKQESNQNPTQRSGSYVFSSATIIPTVRISCHS